MKRALVLVVLVLGCGSGSGSPSHYDRPCSGTPPAGGWCASCAPGFILGGSDAFACGNTCILGTQECSAPPGCACNTFSIK